MVSELTARRFFVVLLVAATLLVAALVRPIGSALLVAAVLAGVLWPVQIRLSRLARKRGLAASILVSAAVLLLVGPLVTLSAFVIKEGTEGMRFVSKTVRSEGVAGLIEKLPGGVQKLAHGVLARLPGEPGAGIDESVERQVSAQGGKAAAAVGAAVAATGSLVFHAVLMMIALFLFLVHGDALVTWLDGALPLKAGQTMELLAEFKRVSFAVIISSVVTAAVQAIAALIGYLIARVPYPVFFAAATFVLAFIPAIGAAVVCLVAALLLYVTGHPYLGLFLAIWGLVVVGLVDNVIKPLLIKRGMQINSGLVFFSLIGGLAAFGTVGLIIGPLVVALFLALLRIYHRDFGGDRPPPTIPGDTPPLRLQPAEHPDPGAR